MVASNKPQTVDIADLNREHTQLRAAMDDAAVVSYAEQYNTRKNGSDRMPPVTVYESQSGELYLVDGFHRVAAKEQLRQKTIPAIIEPGELDDAIIAAEGKPKPQRGQVDERRQAKRCGSSGSAIPKTAYA